MSTDRPDTAEASTAVPPRVFQVETSAAFDHLGRSFGDGTRVTSTGFFTPTLFRYGLLENFELRLASDGISWQRDRAASTGTEREFREAGIANPGIGFKWNFLPSGENGSAPSLGFLFELNLPVGTALFRPPEPEPSFNLAADFGLSGEWDLGTNVGLAVLEDEEVEVRFSQVFFAAALSRSWTERIGYFLELFGRGPDVKDGDVELFIDGGLVFEITPDVQLDFAVARGLTEASSDWAGTFGVSFRLY